MTEPESRKSAAIPSAVILNQFKTIGTAIALIFLTLGSYSEAADLIREGYTEVVSKFTHFYEYEMIEKLHVGYTVSYIEKLVGEPQVSRALGGGISSNYFFTEKYLITLFYYKEERVIAYTVLTLEEGFKPSISGLDDEIGRIGEFLYAALPAGPEKQLVAHSRVASYYLESIDTELSGRFLDLYMGTVNYGAGGTGTHIRSFSKSKVFGSDEELRAASAELRTHLRPNLYGRGDVPLEMIEKSLLSTAEFMDYFDPK